jgi:hypothetical protein
MTLGPRKEPRYTLLISQKSWQTNPLQVPQQGPHEERGPSIGNLASLSKTSTFGFPSKGALPPGSPSQNPSQGDAPPLESSSICLTKSLVYEPPHKLGSTRPERGPHRERRPYPETFPTHLPGSPMKELPQTPSTEPLHRERHFIHRAPFIHLSKSPVDKPSSRFPKRGPY